MHSAPCGHLWDVFIAANVIHDQHGRLGERRQSLRVQQQRLLLLAT
jgi:hypothetical protein